MIRVAVVGATGYAGAELVRILCRHPDAELTVLTSRQFAGVRFEKVYPALTGFVDHVCEELDPDKLCDRADVVFLALPHKLPMELAPSIVNRNKKVIDLSADFRFRNVPVYETAYQPHTARELSEKAVYGLSEIYFDEIRQADLIGNPGCYPTSVLLPLIPLVKENIMDLGTLVADSKSGVSGAGRSLAATSHFCEVHESFKAYKVAQHRHNPEMEEVLSREAGKAIALTFVPHLIPISRGMLTTIYANLIQDVDEQEVRDRIDAFYAGREFVRVCPAGRIPDTRNVRGTNFCDIGIVIDRHAKRMVLISAIDNLVKGAAGQAVQNMNIMFGLEETRGLMQVPLPL